MSNTICFDRVADAKSILKSGISETSVRARSELRTAAWYLVNKTTYTQKQIQARLRNASENYFRGMSDEYIDSNIENIISSVEQESSTEDGVAVQPITIYKEELDKIAELHHDDTERLAFVFLCVAKMHYPYEQIYECNSQLYQLAWQYKYDCETKCVVSRQEKRRVGGKEPTKRVHRLCDAGIVRYYTRINAPYRQIKNRSTAYNTFSIPILQTDGEVAFMIDKPDKESLVLYYDRFKGYSGIVTCERCGKPVLRTGRRHKYCSECADTINHYPEKRDL